VKVLVTSANSAEAYQLKNKLKTDTVILGDYLELPEFMVRSGAMIHLPNPSSVSYNHQMLALSLDKGFNGIYPLREEEAALLQEARQLFKEYNIDIYL
jgi:hypothetical protein